MNKFKKLGLSSSTVDILDQMGFEKPTPIQEKAIPALINNNPTDFIGLAQTGTGKTAAFGLPLIEMIDTETKSTQALIMSPTRELGQQIAKQLKEFSANNRALNIEVVYGGAAISNQIKALKKPTQIVVATPGRLLDLIKRRAIKLDMVEYIVLDEADEMLNMGFKEAIDEILSYTNEIRTTWLFSATMPADIRRIVKRYMDEPIEVSINSEEKSNKDISHKYVVTKASNKLAALRRFLDIQPDMRGVMFCRTKRETQQIADKLSQNGYEVEALHGDLSQSQRDAVMKRFKARSMQLLIATDVAARGIDVNDLTHVLHHSLPDQLESYTHRSGRTGRAGKKGISLAFIGPSEGNKIKALEKKIKVTFEKIEVPGIQEITSSRINSWASLIINTKVDPQADVILNNLHGQFAHLSKEDLLQRLITTQLDHLQGSSRDKDGNRLDDLNEKNQSRGNNSKGGSYNRYFVNIGSIDGMTKGDLLHFLSDISKVDRKYFGDLNMQKNCAFFELDKNKDSGLGKKFQGIEIEGRGIRVNRDDDGGKKRQKNKSGMGRRKQRKSRYVKN